MFQLRGHTVSCSSPRSLGTQKSQNAQHRPFPNSPTHRPGRLLKEDAWRENKASDSIPRGISTLPSLGGLNSHILGTHKYNGWATAAPLDLRRSERQRSGGPRSHSGCGKKHAFSGPGSGIFLLRVPDSVADVREIRQPKRRLESHSVGSPGPSHLALDSWGTSQPKVPRWGGAGNRKAEDVLQSESGREP